MNRKTEPAQDAVKKARGLMTLLFGLYAVYQIFVIVTAIGAPAGDWSELVVTLLQALAGIALTFLPELLRRLHWIEMRPGLEMAYLVFLFLALFLGTLMRFFVNVSFWDTLTHALASALGAFALYGIWEAVAMSWSEQVTAPSEARGHAKSEATAATHRQTAKRYEAPQRTGRRASQGKGLLQRAPWDNGPMGYGFALGMTLVGGVLWEIYEFTIDAFMPKQNLQRYAAIGGGLLEGRAALMDTMVDLIWDLTGAVVALVIVWGIRKKTGRRLGQVRFRP
ncbi:MAG: hypothetical protein PUJ57_03640 [Peptoniphilaceae bacterium]|nr:hypothetical protein [Peptoniphilaceae bacterium]MDY6085147.1 hypothetical protein [Peptoniphilaceae bacterium]